MNSPGPLCALFRAFPGVIERLQRRESGERTEGEAPDLQASLRMAEERRELRDRELFGARIRR